MPFRYYFYYALGKCKKTLIIGFQLFHKMRIAFAFLMNSILLGIAYFSVLGLTSLIARIAQKKFLDTRILKDNHTYWTNIELQDKSLESFQRMF